MKLYPRHGLILALVLLGGCDRGGSGSISGGLGDQEDATSANVRLAMSATGYGFAAWELSSGGTTRIAVNSYVPLAGWGGVEFPQNGGGAAHEPDVAMGRYTQDAVFVWAQENDHHDFGVYAVRWNGTDNVWGEIEQIALYGDRMFVFKPRVAVGGNGEPVAVWTLKTYDGNDPHFAVYASRSERGETGPRWTSPEQLDRAPEGSDAFEAEIVMNDSGVAIATMLYEDAESSETTLQAALLQPPFDGGPPIWSEPIKISTEHDAVGFDSHRAAIDASGSAVFVWSETIHGKERAYVNRMVPGEGFRGPARLDPSGPTTTWPDVTCDFYGGTFLMVWGESAEESGTTLHARRLVGNDWSDPETIAAGRGKVTWLRATMAEDGSANVIWVEPDAAGAKSLVGSRYVVEQGWQAPVPVEGDGGDVEAPALRSDFGGHCLAAWERDDGQHVDVWANDYDPAQGWGGASSR